VILILVVTIFNFSSCGNINSDDNDGKLKIVATLFPQYDFARQIAGDKADVKLLLPPGVESHSFEPTPRDIIEIYNADLFLYTGDIMEPWAAAIIKGITNENLTVVDCSENIELLHDDEDDEDEDEDEDDGRHDHGHGADPHIWLDPNKAIKMVKDIFHAIREKDPDNYDFYLKNVNDYMNELWKLDNDISDVIEKAERNVIVFGGRFSYIYFLTRYNLDYVTAYDSCSTYAEPSVAKVAYVIDFIRENNIPCIYHEELSDPKVAKSIAKETNIEYLQFSTAHNITKSEFDDGVTFLDIMYANLENLKKGLN